MAAKNKSRMSAQHPTKLLFARLIRRKRLWAYMSFAAAVTTIAMCNWSDRSGFVIRTNSGTVRHFLEVGVFGRGLWIQYYSASVTETEFTCLLADRGSYLEWGRRDWGIEFDGDDGTLSAIKLVSPRLPSCYRRSLPPVTVMIANTPTALSGFSLVGGVIPLWIPLLFFCGAGVAFLLRSRRGAKHKREDGTKSKDSGTVGGVPGESGPLRTGKRVNCNMAEKAEPPTNDSWRCPNCLYSLRGLRGARIICPECGEEHSARQLDEHLSEDADSSLEAMFDSIALGGLFAIAFFLGVVLRGYNPETARWLSAWGACGLIYACFKYNRQAKGREGRWAFFLYTQLGVCLLLAVLTGGFFAIEWASSALSVHWGVSKQWLSLL